MNLKQIEYALAVVDTGSFTRAAERCHVVQSALSHQIARLEETLGVSLFERSSRRVRLTPAGEAFVQSARPALEATRRIAEDVAAACGEVRGQLSIGEITSLTELDLVDLLADFHAQHPLVDIRWLMAKSELLIAAAGVRHRVQFEVTNIRLVEKFAKRGLAIGLVPARIANSFNGVMSVAIEDAPVRHVYAIWSMHPTPAARAFAQLIEQRLAVRDGH